jgi:hypothetical protein
MGVGMTCLACCRWSIRWFGESAGFRSLPVTQHFITLCERAATNYPADVFADQVLAQIAEGHLPAGWKGTTIPAGVAGRVQVYADRHHLLPAELARKHLQVLDALVDLGDRRSAALQLSEAFRGVLLTSPPT